MTEPASSPFEALIVDYNGVIGHQPTDDRWARLASLAGWDDVRLFQRAFWRLRTKYDEGTITSRMFWSGLLQDGRSLDTPLLEVLTGADMAMWTSTDTAVLRVLEQVHAAGTPMVLLSNAPRPLADILDRTPWRSRLFSHAIYSAHLAVNKPHRRAYEAALVAAGHLPPERVLLIDDQLPNIEAAQAFGLQTHHYTGDPAALAGRVLGTVPVTA